MFVWEHLAKQPLPYIISYLINIVLNMSLVGIFGSSNRSSLHFFIGTGKHTKNLAFKNTWYPIISKTNWKLLDSIVSVGFTAVLIVNQSIDHLFQLGTLHLFGEVLVVHLKHCGHKGCDILHAKRWSHVTCFAKTITRKPVTRRSEDKVFYGKSFTYLLCHRDFSLFCVMYIFQMMHWRVILCILALLLCSYLTLLTIKRRGGSKLVSWFPSMASSRDRLHVFFFCKEKATLVFWFDIDTFYGFMR